jgi:hypothetical protein
VTQTEILEYCTVGKGLGIVRRRLWLREKRNTECLRKETPAQYFRSHRTEKGKRKKRILSVVQQKKEVHLRSKSMSNPLTPCASPRSEAETRTLSREIVVSGGSQNNSQNSGSSTTNQSQSTSPKVSTTQNTMAGIDNTLRMPEFQGVGQKTQRNICLYVRRYGLRRMSRMRQQRLCS